MTKAVLKKLPLPFFFLILFFFPWNAEAYTYDLAVAAIFQNEARFMKEWIDYHLVAGVEHFFLYNNNSKDDYLEVLQPYIEKGLVELVDWPSLEITNNYTYVLTVQCPAYNDALSKARHQTKWLAIIDLDEFILPRKGFSISDTLKKYFKKEVGICVNWQCFGTSFVPFIFPHESMLQKLHLRMKNSDPYHLFIKSIVRPEFVTSCTNCHFCNYVQGKYHVNTNYEKVDHNNTGFFNDKLVINHYWTRDEWHFNHIKIPRYTQWNFDVSHAIDLNNRMNQVEDTKIHRFLPLIKKQSSLNHY